MRDDHRRVQIYFERRSEATRLSHLELMQALHGAVHASGLPVRTSGGDERKPKISFSSALPRGMESRLECFELAVGESVTIREILEALRDRMPPGISIVGGDALYPGEKWRVAAIRYEIRGDDLPDGEELADLLARSRIPMERRGRKMDLRRLLLGAERTPDALSVWIAWTDAGTARPDDVLRAFGREPGDFVVEKTGTEFRTSFGETIRKPDDT